MLIDLFTYLHLPMICVTFHGHFVKLAAKTGQFSFVVRSVCKNVYTYSISFTHEPPCGLADFLPIFFGRRLTAISAVFRYIWYRVTSMRLEL